MVTQSKRSGNETETGQNEHGDHFTGTTSMTISPDLTKSDERQCSGKSLRRSNQSVYDVETKNMEDNALDSTDELIFELDDDDDLELYLPEKTTALAREKKTSDSELFENSFEALSIEHLSASLFDNYDKQGANHVSRKGENRFSCDDEARVEGEHSSTSSTGLHEELHSSVSIKYNTPLSSTTQADVTSDWQHDKQRCR